MTRRTMLGALLATGVLAVVPRVQAQQPGPFDSGPGLVDLVRPINPVHPLAQGLLAWWIVLPQVSGGGTRWVELARQLPGTLTNMAQPPTATSGWGRTTRRPNAWGEVRFAGDNDYINIGVLSAFDFPNQQFTVSLWHRATVTGYLVTRRNTSCASSNCGGYFVRINADGTYSARIIDAFNTSAADRPSVSTTALNGAWHHIAVVFTTDTVTRLNNDVAIYHNGVLDQGARTDSAVGPYYVSPYGLMMGTTSEFATFLTGAMDDIRVYTRGLSAKEVGALYVNSRVGYPGLLRRLPLATSSVTTTTGRRSRGRVF